MNTEEDKGYKGEKISPRSSVVEPLTFNQEDWVQPPAGGLSTHTC